MHISSRVTSDYFGKPPGCILSNFNLLCFGTGSLWVSFCPYYIVYILNTHYSYIVLIYFLTVNISLGGGTLKTEQTWDFKGLIWVQRGSGALI